MVKFCAGLPQTGIRNLAADELGQIRVERAAERRWAVLVWVTIPFLFLLSLAALSGISGGSIWFPLSAIPAFAAIGAGVAFGRDRGRRAKALRRDLLKGTVLVFEGPITLDLADSRHMKMIQSRLLLDDVNGEPQCQCLEVLECSGRLFKVNGDDVLRWITFDLAEIAERPSDPSFFPKQITQLDLQPEGTPFSRSLSDEEKRELRRSYRRAIAAAVPSGLLALYFGFIALAILISQSAWHTSRDYGLAVFCLLFGVLSIFFLSVAGRLKQDIQAGIVLIVDADAGAIFEEGELRSSHRVSVEALPISGRLWTVDGYPAEWRAQEAKRPSPR